MSLYYEVEQYYEPGEQLKACLNPKCEMSDFDWGFLCGLLKRFKPRNIVEVGIAEGGTSVLLDLCMQMLGIQDYHISSVDVTEQYYSDKSKVSGYEYQRAVESGIIKNDRHQFYLGKFLPEVLEIITDGGKLIDFLILDTVHSAPGELFDFILAIPFLKENAVICLHDVNLDYISPMDRIAYINKLIFDVAQGKKFLNVSGAESRERYGVPNIAAIQVTADTRSHMMDLFSSFSFPWAYLPGDKEIALYRSMYSRLYGADCVALFDKYVYLNKNSFENRFKRIYSIQLRDEGDKLKTFCDKGNLYLYGAGDRCRDYLLLFEIFDIAVEGLVVSDGHKKQEVLMGKNVWEWSELKVKHPDANVVVAVADKEIVAILKESGINFYIPHRVFNDMAYGFRGLTEVMKDGE